MLRRARRRFSQGRENAMRRRKQIGYSKCTARNEEPPKRLTDGTGRERRYAHELGPRANVAQCGHDTGEEAIQYLSQRYRHSDTPGLTHYARPASVAPAYFVKLRH